MLTIILFGESSKGEVKADFKMVPLALVGEFEDNVDEFEFVGELAEVAAGEVADDEVEALDMADESDELLSDKPDEPSVRLLLLLLLLLLLVPFGCCCCC